ncbi:MAG: YbaB/EbfC family nucleoid-associated protein [Verrucomicrobiota bacterium]|nr:YbaB/EbfC family nucleoid-associated protein [Verrucomicrobiota bacterium]
MGSGFSKMKKQARLMQDQAREMEAVLRQKVVEGSAGGGLVRITLNGEIEILKVTIAPECTSDIDGLQDLIIAAHRDAIEKLRV